MVERRQGLTHVYRSGGRKPGSDIYDVDHAGARGVGRFRWLVSTCLAAAVGAVAIGVAIFGSLDPGESAEGVLPILRRLRDTRTADNMPLTQATPAEGLRWSTPKSDRLQTSYAMQSSAQIIHEQVQVKRDNRPFIQIRPYMKVTARLAALPMVNADVLPPFNPFRLYSAQSSTSAGADSGSPGSRTDVTIRVVELLGGILPSEDGQELDTQEVMELVARAQEGDTDTSAPRATGASESGGGAGGDVRAGPQLEAVPPNTTVLTKSKDPDSATAGDLERNEVRVLRVGRGDTLTKMLIRLGAEAWQAKAMVEAAKSIFPESALAPGQEVHVTLVPSLTRPDRMEPARFSVYGDGHDHKVSVNRSQSGDFVPSKSPFDSRVVQAALGSGDQVDGTSLYASLYNACLTFRLSPETILQIMRIHAYETDFRRRTANSDSAELFFDVKEEKGADSVPGELLYSSVVVAGEPQRYWRFRTPDGTVDYYDEQGNTSRKFLVRRPVRGEAIHLVSGFGIRRHPLLMGVTRMHTGVDWAGPTGTPIMAGGNGVIEEAKYKGDYGNYIRIRHANGYSTAYGHMSRFAPGMVEGTRVRQGQVIGFIGSTGLAEGPHVHYEVLVNDRFVDPMSIEVPRERKLTGKALTDFQKERARIDDLMRRTPVVVANR